MGVAATQMEKRGIVTDKGKQNRNIRAENRLLKEVKRRISAPTAWIKEKTAQAEEYQSINPITSSPFHSPTLLELLNHVWQEKEMPQSQYRKIKDLKAYAQAVNFLQSRNINTLLELQKETVEIKGQYWDCNKAIKQTEKLLHEKKELIEYSEKYLKYKAYHQEYLQIKLKKQDAYEEKYRTELTLYQAAERYLKEKLGKGGSIKLETWKMKIAALVSEKEHLYREVNRLKSKGKEVETVKKL